MPANIEKIGATYYARFKVRGRNYRRSLRTASEVEAVKRARALKKQIEADHWSGDRMTWQAAAVRYGVTVLPEAVKPGTAKRYLVSLKAVDPWLASRYLDEIDRPLLSGMVEARKKAGVTNATINRDLTAISQVLACGIEWGACEHNAAREFNRRLLTRERRDPIVPPSDEAVARVIARAPGLFARLIEFLAREGCREEEAASLEWPWVRLAAKQAMLPKTKTSRARVLNLSDATVAMLRALPRYLRKEPGPDYVFWHGEGERYLNVSSRFAQIRTEVGETFRAHDLRHKFAIDFLRARGGNAIYDLQQHLGHASVKTTEHYLQFVAAEASKNASILPEKARVSRTPERGPEVSK